MILSQKKLNPLHPCTSHGAWLLKKRDKQRSLREESGLPGKTRGEAADQSRNRIMFIPDAA
jgi:hypothetical protein